MSRKSSLFRQRVTSQWSSYLPLWLIATTVWCVNSTLLLGFALRPNNIFAAATANAFSAVLMIFLAFGWRGIQRKISITGRTPVWAVFVMGALVGFVKATSTYSILWGLTGVPITFQALLQNTVPAVISGLWLLPAFAIVGSIRADYDTEREVLISEIVARELSAATSKYLEQDVAQFVVRARDQLSQASGSTAEFRQALMELAERDVRPMSHKLWAQEDSHIEKFGFRDLAITAIRQHHFPAAWTSGALFFSLMSLQVPLVGLADATTRSFFQSLVAYIVLTLGRLIPLRGLVSGPIVFFSTPLVLVVVIEIGTQLWVGPLPGVNSLIAESILYLSLLTTLLILGAVFTARETHEEVHSKLSALRTESMAADADKIIQLIRRRETAELLHGYVQNQLLSNAVKLETAPASLDEVQRVISHMLEELEQGEHSSQRTESNNLKELGNLLQEVWRGVMKVTVSQEGREPVTSQELLVLDRILNELIANAHRHGLASEISATITATLSSITIIAEDNGTGLGSGTPGLGTALLSTLSGGNWSRETLKGTSRGTKVRCELARSEDQ
jgi:two-component sensor histidine kinase